MNGGTSIKAEEPGTCIFLGKLLGGNYTTPEMNRIWSEEEFIKKILEVEYALAKAEAELGLIPELVPAKIRELIDRQVLEDIINKIASVKGKARHLMVSIMYAVAEELGEYGEYFHLGPTTQDILDTALILSCRDSIKILIESIKELTRILLEKSKEFRLAVMAGRTHGQHAVPITFGLKLALWADIFIDHYMRLTKLYEQVSNLHLSGAVGTMASFVQICGGDKDKALKIHELTSQYLGLNPVFIDQHQRIDRFAEITQILALIANTIAQIGLEIRDLSREEVKEVFEPWELGVHGSSTMPQKRNPEPSEWLEGIAKISRVLPLTLNSVTMQHERDATRMAPEFLSLPLSFMLSHAQIKSLTRIIKGLKVYEDVMRKNLYVSRGFMLAEPLMLELAKRTGKKVTAHKIVYEIVQRAVDENKTFQECIRETPEIKKYFKEEELEKLLDLESYIGTSLEQIEKIYERASKEMGL
ncbi:MAG: adenylosuccinate lyase [Saccharolobus sp.]|uniref:adenylosuccinate lyase n=1 Tax=Saccharolobus sp. TaxID=2100761 RepID=UPI00317FD85E